jgi:hypothetical protein
MGKIRIKLGCPDLYCIAREIYTYPIEQDELSFWIDKDMFCTVYRKTLINGSLRYRPSRFDRPESDWNHYKGLG